MYEVDRSTPEFRRYLELYETADLLALGRMADDTRWRLHPDPVVTYIIDRNINTPTSVSPTASSAPSTGARGTARATS
jgi:hypothetical protein